MLKLLIPVFHNALINEDKCKENIKTKTDNGIIIPAISWYKSLSINQKIALKEISELICGMKWEDFNSLFSPRERLAILHNKLRLEGLDV